MKKGASPHSTISTESAMVYATVSLSSADLKSLNTSPKTLVAAPGTGKYIQVLHWGIVYNYLSAAYQNVSGPGISYRGLDPEQDIFVNTADPGSLFTGSSTGVAFGPASSGVFAQTNTRAVFSRTNIENKDIVFVDVTDWTTGDGTAKISIEYEIVDIP